MLRFGLWISGLSLLLAAFTFGVMLWGRTQPNPVDIQKAGFDLCDGNPCYKGITPGITKWDSAKKMLASEGADVQEDEAQLTTGNIEMTAEEIAEKINTVSLVVMDNSVLDYSSEHSELPSLGYFISKYGTPCKFVLSDDTTKQAIIVYPSMEVTAILDNYRVEPSSRVDTVSMAVPAWDSNCSYFENNPVISAAVAPWLGFTSLNHYMMQAVEQNQ